MTSPLRALPLLLAFATAAFAANSASPAPSAPPAPARPNILLIYLDDMGWGQPGVYGGLLAPTPHIDALAASGTRFTQGYVSSPVCSPSRAGLMTGQYQGRFAHDFLNTPDLPLDRATLADRLHALGYATGIVGKWHLGSDRPHLPGSRGFDSGFGSVANLGKGGFYDGAENRPNPPESPLTTPLYTEKALDFIARHSPAPPVDAPTSSVAATPARPWFLYLAFNAIHVPLAASPAWLDRFPAIENKRTRTYAAMISEVDDAIGRILAELERRHLADDTLVFLLSDNGAIFDAAELGGLRGRKYLVWEGGIRVPFIVSWPGHLRAGRVLEDPVIQLDLTPTLLAAAGAPATPDQHLDGIDLLPLLRGDTAHLAPRTFYWRYGVQFAIRQGDWKLVKASQDMAPMLVDLAKDRGEQHDLSADYPKKARELLDLWTAWNATLPPQRMDVADHNSFGGPHKKGRDNDD